jgi:hypothetical protein
MCPQLVASRACLWTPNAALCVSDNTTVIVIAAAALCSFPRRLITLCVDGVAILIGSLLGTSPLTVVAESSVGIKEGGRTGGSHCQATAPTSSQYCLNSKCMGASTVPALQRNDSCCTAVAALPCQMPC